MITLATAGSGKTRSLVNQAMTAPARRTALVTYTRNGAEELRKATFREKGYLPENIRIYTWFSFLLQHLVRPYQWHVFEDKFPFPIKALHFVQEISAKYSNNKEPRHYFKSPGVIYSDKVSKFACRVLKKTNDAPIQRLKQIYDQISVDECQDLAGYDLDLIEHLLKANLETHLVGDIRQATFSTNRSNRNTQFLGAKVIDKFREWESDKLATIQTKAGNYRSIQPICDFADALYPNMSSSVSLIGNTTFHDGLFFIHPNDVER